MTAVFANVQDPARESQRVFRACLDAMARPGVIRRLPASPSASLLGLPALAFTLCDFETPVWLDWAAAADRTLSETLRFGANAPTVESPADAAFAFIADPMALPRLDSFALGTIENPERSTTLLIAVERLEAGRGWTLTGPGIADAARLFASPLPADVFAQRQALQTLFPRGLDIIFVCGERVAALPRSTQVEG
jgi:alpha-D-ribose 1-methylphosphonate 5-triphosphate synthase subunit PhnH